MVTIVRRRVPTPSVAVTPKHAGASSLPSRKKPPVAYDANQFIAPTDAGTAAAAPTPAASMLTPLNFEVTSDTCFVGSYRNDEATAYCLGFELSGDDTRDITGALSGYTAKGPRRISVGSRGLAVFGDVRYSNKFYLSDLSPDDALDTETLARHLMRVAVIPHSEVTSYLIVYFNPVDLLTRQSQYAPAATAGWAHLTCEHTPAGASVLIRKMLNAVLGKAGSSVKLKSQNAVWQTLPIHDALFFKCPAARAGVFDRISALAADTRACPSRDGTGIVMHSLEAVTRLSCKVGPSTVEFMAQSQRGIPTLSWYLTPEIEDSVSGSHLSGCASSISITSVMTPELFAHNSTVRKLLVSEGWFTQEDLEGCNVARVAFLKALFPSQTALIDRSRTILQALWASHNMAAAMAPPTEEVLDLWARNGRPLPAELTTTANKLLALWRSNKTPAGTGTSLKEWAAAYFGDDLDKLKRTLGAFERFFGFSLLRVPHSTLRRLRTVAATTAMPDTADFPALLDSLSSTSTERHDSTDAMRRLLTYMQSMLGVLHSKDVVHLRTLSNLGGLPA